MGKINVDLQFTANTQQAKAQLDQLKNSLNQLGNMTNINLKTDKMTKEMLQASNAALQLKTQLDAATNVNTGKLSLTKFNQELKASGMTLNSYASKLAALGPQGTQAFEQLTESIIRADSAISTGSKLLANFTQTLANVAKYQLSTAVYRGFTQAISTAYNYAQDLNKSLNNIRIVTGQSIDQMDKFADRANKAAKALSTTTTAYTDAALIFYQQGLNDKQVEERTNATIKMANVTGDSVKEVSNQLTAIWNNFDNGTKSLEHYADIITALGAATASSTSEISEGLEKFAAIAETVGLSYEYATTALATVTAETRQSADVVGTAFKTLFARIQDLELGKTLEDGTTLGKYAQALQTIGVNVKDANGEVRDMNHILDDMGAKWGGLSDATKIAVAQTVAGQRQYAQLMALMNNWGKFQENLQVAQDSEGALNAQAELYAQGWEGAKKRVQAAAEDIYSTLLDDDFFISFNNGMAKVLDAITAIVKGMGGLKGIIPLVTSLLLQFAGPQILAGLNNMKTSLIGMLPAWLSFKDKDGNGGIFRKGAAKNFATNVKNTVSEQGLFGLVNGPDRTQTEGEATRSEAFEAARKMQKLDTTTGQLKVEMLNKQQSITENIQHLNQNLTQEQRDHLQALRDRNAELQKTVTLTSQEVDKAKEVAKTSKQDLLDNANDARFNFEADKNDYVNGLRQLHTASAVSRTTNDWEKRLSSNAPITGNLTTLGLRQGDALYEFAQNNLSTSQKATLEKLRQEVSSNGKDDVLSNTAQQSLEELTRTLQAIIKRRIKNAEQTVEKAGEAIGLDEDVVDDAIVYAKSNTHGNRFNATGYQNAIYEGQTVDYPAPTDLTAAEQDLWTSRNLGTTSLEEVVNTFEAGLNTSVNLDYMLKAFDPATLDPAKVSLESLNQTMLDLKQQAAEFGDQNIIDTFKDLDGNAKDATTAINKLTKAHERLEQANIDNNTELRNSEKALQLKAKAEGNSNDKIKSVITNIKTATDKQRENNTAVLAAREGYKDIQAQINQYRTSLQSLGASALQGLRGITSLASSINMLKSIISIFNDTEKSFGERLLTALPMMLPMISMAISGFTSFASAIGNVITKLNASTIATQAQTIATKINTAMTQNGVIVDEAKAAGEIAAIARSTGLVSSKGAQTVAEKVLTKAKEKGTVVTWQMVAAEIAAQAAAGPIVWIIMLIVGALAALIGIMSAVAAAEKKQRENQIQRNKEIIEENKETQKLINSNQDLATSIDNLVESYQTLQKNGQSTYDTMKQMEEEIPKLIKSYKDLGGQLDDTWLNNQALELEAEYNIAKSTGNWDTFIKKKEEIDKAVKGVERDTAKDSFTKGADSVVKAILNGPSADMKNGKLRDILGGDGWWFGDGGDETKFAKDLINNTDLGHFITAYGGVSDYAPKLINKFFGYTDAFGALVDIDTSDPAEVLRYYKALKEAAAYGRRGISEGTYKKSDLGGLKDIEAQIKDIEKAVPDLEELRKTMIDLEIEDFDNTTAKSIKLNDYINYYNDLIKDFTNQGYTEEEAKGILTQSTGLEKIRTAKIGLNKYVSELSSRGFNEQDFIDIYDSLLTDSQREAFNSLSDDDLLLKTVTDLTSFYKALIEKENKNALTRLKEEITSEGLDSDVWDIYRNSIAETNDLLQENTAITGQVAKDNMVFNAGIESAAKAWKTYAAAINQGNKASSEYAEGLGAIKKAFKSAFGTDVSVDWIESNWDLINRVISGNYTENDQKSWEKALDENAQNYINNIESADGRKVLQQIYDTLQGKTAEEIARFTTENREQWLEWLNSKGVTAEQVQTLTNTMGLSYDTRTMDMRVSTRNLNSLDRNQIQKEAGTDKASKQKLKLYEDEIDAYHEINKSIEEANQSLSRYEELAEASYGATKLSLMDKQIQELETINDLYKEQQEQAQENSTLYYDKLAEIGYHIEAENGKILNYTELYTAAVDELNKAADKLNKGIINKAQFDEISDKYTNFQNYISAYEEATKKYNEAVDNKLSNSLKQQEKYYDKLTESLEQSLVLNENDQKAIDYFLGKVEDDIYKIAEASQYLEKQYTNVTEKFDIYNNAYKELEKSYQEGSLTSANYVDGLQKQYDETINNLEALNDYDNKMKEYYGETLSNAIDEMDKYLDHMDKQAEVLSHYQNLLKVGGYEFDFAKQAILLNGLLQQDVIQADELAEKMVFLEQRRAEVQRNLAAATNDEVKEKLQKDLDDINDQIIENQEAQFDNAEQHIDHLKDKLDNDIKAAAKNAEDSITNGLGLDRIENRLTNIKNLSNIYLDNTNKIYETNKMINQVNQAIEKTDNQAAKERYKSFIDDIKQMQNKGKLTKTELELAQNRYKVLQAQIALEEAQNAKSIVRLRRDNEGNFGYVYTATDSQVANAQQAVDDAENAYYNKRIQIIQNEEDASIKAAQNLYKDLQDLLQQYLNGEITDWDTYQQLRNEKIKQYNDEAAGHAINLQLALGDEDSGIIGDMTDAERELLDNVQNVNDGIMQSVDENFPKVEEETYNTREAIQALTNSFIGGGADEGLTSAVNENVSAMDALAKRLGNINDANSVIGKLNSAMSAANGLTAAWSNQKDKIDALRKYYETEFLPMIEAAIKKQQELNRISNIDNINGNITNPERYESKLATVTQIGNTLYVKDTNGNWWNHADIQPVGADSILRLRNESVQKQNSFVQQANDWANKKITEFNATEDDIRNKYGTRSDSKGNLHYRNEVLQNYGNNSWNPWSDNTFEEDVSQTLVNDLIDIKKNIANERAAKIAEEKYRAAQLSEYKYYEKLRTNNRKYTYDPSQDGTILQPYANDISKENAMIKQPYNENFMQGDYIIIAITEDENQDLYYWLKNPWGVPMGAFKEQDLQNIGFTPTFDTGGYTGQWGPSGKLAMLHQKEIVLNADDTKNFLQAIDILRSIVSVIDLGAMQAMSGSMVSSSINSANNNLNQNVTIHAEFPNAVNHSEIEQAFDNLVNKASQYANRY